MDYPYISPGQSLPMTSACTMIGRHKCPGIKHHPDHCQARGKVCKSTEDYTDDMARKIHEAWKRSCASRPAKQGPPIAAKAMPTIAGKQKREALEGLPCEAGGLLIRSYSD